jgi:hypothetical protein
MLDFRGYTPPYHFRRRLGDPYIQSTRDEEEEEEKEEKDSSPTEDRTLIPVKKPSQCNN